MVYMFFFVKFCSPNSSDIETGTSQNVLVPFLISHKQLAFELRVEFFFSVTLGFVALNDFFITLINHIPTYKRRKTTKKYINL